MPRVLLGAALALLGRYAARRLWDDWWRYRGDVLDPELVRRSQ